MSITSKLMEIQTKMKAPKNLYNSFGEYKYRNAEGILEAVKPFLTMTNTCVTLSDDIVAVGDRIYVKATAELIDNESGDVVRTTAFARESEEKKKLDASQLTGVASSYARKYALNGLFALDDTKDADTDEFHKQTQDAPRRAVEPVEASEAVEGTNTLTDTEVMVIEALATQKSVSIQTIMDAYKVTDLHQLNSKQYTNLMTRLKKSSGKESA